MVPPVCTPHAVQPPAAIAQDGFSPHVAEMRSTVAVVSCPVTLDPHEITSDRVGMLNGKIDPETGFSYLAISLVAELLHCLQYFLLQGGLWPASRLNWPTNL